MNTNEDSLVAASDALRAALQAAGVEIATHYPAADSWLLVTRTAGRRQEIEAPTADLKRTLERLAGKGGETP
jgi:hypothetical protein